MEQASISYFFIIKETKYLNLISNDTNQFLLQPNEMVYYIQN